MPDTIQYLVHPPGVGFKVLLTAPVAVPAMGTTAKVLAANSGAMTAALQSALQARLAPGAPADGKPSGRLVYTVDRIDPGISGSTAKITVWYETR